jgi:hypothetical protein
MWKRWIAGAISTAPLKKLVYFIRVYDVKPPSDKPKANMGRFGKAYFILLTKALESFI